MRPFLLACALLVAIAPSACKRDDDEEEEAPKKKKKKKAPKPDDSVALVDAGSETNDLGPKPKSLPGGDLLAPTESELLKASGGQLTMSIEGEAPVFKYGRAQLGWGGLHVTLSTEKTGCAYATPGDESYQIDFDLSPGPGGGYYAGHAIGLAVSWNSARLKLKQSHAGPHQTKLLLDPFVAKDGEHVKGTLSVDQSTKVSRPDGTRVQYEYRARGAFDVVICPAFGGVTGLDPLAKTAGPGLVTGTFAGHAFTAMSALAFVQKDWSTGLHYLDSIELYPVAEPPCSDRYKLTASEHLTIRAIGGSGTLFALTGQQPMEPTFTIPKTAGGLGYPKWFGGGQRRGWIQFDAFDLSATKLSGEMFAESSAKSKPDETGKLTGRFTAKVCGGI